MYKVDSVPKEGKMNYRFHLEKYKTPSSRHTCPACGQKRTFVKYIDSEDLIRFPHYVGRCNREQKCGYHYTPKQYFADNQIDDSERKNVRTPNQQAVREIEPSYLSNDLVKKSLKQYEANRLFLFFQSKFGEKVAIDLFQKYNVGTANFWNGATVFWQIDTQGLVRTGKIMLYDSVTGKRVKKQHNYITWAHALIKQEEYYLKQCFFGEHLLSENLSSPVALVESEKTAMIASLYIPQYIWLATGGKNGCLNRDAIQILRNRKVVLFPDLGAKDYWQMKSEQMIVQDIDVVVSEYLEKNAHPEQLQEGYDIGDFLIESKPPKTYLETILEKYPVLNLLIETLDLTIV